jgi:hypothetical protein
MEPKFKEYLGKFLKFPFVISMDAISFLTLLSIISFAILPCLPDNDAA